MLSSSVLQLVVAYVQLQFTLVFKSLERGCKYLNPLSFDAVLAHVEIQLYQILLPIYQISENACSLGVQLVRAHIQLKVG